MLTTDHKSASFTTPVFIFGGVGYESGRLTPEVVTPGDFVARAYSKDVDEGRWFSLA